MRTTRPQRLCLTLFLILCLSPVCPAQAQSGRQGSTTQSGKSEEPNGISVGRPKVFDNRTLTLMLESLSESLRNVQTQFINKETLAAAFSFLQGTRTSEVARSFSVSPIPVPSLRQENTTNTGNVSSGGSSLPDTTTSNTVSERPSFTPQPPALDTTPAAFPPGFNPTFGSNPSDLLSDQVNLTYQIFNLRMLLERSLTDRLLDNDQTRRQAVLGFNVTIDPPRTANDAVAVVEITLDAPDSCPNPDDCLSLVSLMPQEKTYNAAALSTKSNAFGGAAVVNMFQVGFSERRRGQVFYLYRDNDTISYERMNKDTKQITFGWMFRPVLGRRSVSPGLRQLFAIVSLPSEDTTKEYRQTKYKERKQSADGALDSLETTKLNATVRTYWKKYDSTTMTSFQPDDTNRAGRFRNAIFFGLTKPEIFAKRYENNATYEDVEVRPTEKYQAGLRPKLDQLTWKLIGQKSVLISARGNNFFTGTQVSIADKTYASSADGLLLKSNQAFDLVTDLNALAIGAGSIIGRYGSAVPLISPYPCSDRGQPMSNGTAQTSLQSTSNCPYGLIIKGASISPSFAGNHLLTIYLQNQRRFTYRPDPTDPQKSIATPMEFVYPPEDEYGKPVITIGGNVVLPPYEVDSYRDVTIDREVGIDSGEAGGQELDPYMGVIRASIPDSFLNKGGGVLKVSYPFLPSEWTATRLISDPAQDFELTRINSKSILIHTKNETGFAKDPRTDAPPVDPQTGGPSHNFCWKVFLGDDKEVRLRTAYCDQAGAQRYADQQAGAARRRGRMRRRGKYEAEAKEAAAAPPAARTSVKRLSDYSFIVTSGTDVPDNIVLVDPYGSVFKVEVPKSTQPPASPPKPVELNQYDSLWIEVAVKDVSKVVSVEANQLTLKYRIPPADDDGNPPKSIKVEITRDLTAKPGDVELTVLDKDGKPLSAIRLHISAAPGKGEKQ